jgi:hypothetical protein
MDAQPFSAKLELVLKAFSMSRARLASALGVDKSLIGRWASGAVTPSQHNLERLTGFVAGKCTGFTMLDWDRDLDTLAGVLGVAAPAATGIAGRRAGLGEIVPPGLFAEAVRGAELRGAAYRGVWRSTRPSSDLPGRFIHDHTLVQPQENGLLPFRTGVEGVDYRGYALVLQHQFFSISADAAHGTLLFSIFNSVARLRAEVLDGITLACLRDAGSSPIASTCLLERVADPGDPEDDERLYEKLVAEQGNPIAPEGSVPEAVQRHLTREAGMDAMGCGGLLRMFFGRSMARGPSLETLVEPKV